MSEQRTAPSRGSAASRRQPAGSGGNPLGRLLGSIVLFVKQILDELRKVVRPTRKELTTYTSVVIVFVTVIMLLVFGLDTLVTKLVFWVFAG